MTYEELKQQTIDVFLNMGFVQDGDKLTKTNIRQHQIVINGQPSVQEERQMITITIIGEGDLSGQVLLGFNVNVGNRDAGDFWIKDASDMHAYFNN